MSDKNCHCCIYIFTASHYVHSCKKVTRLVLDCCCDENMVQHHSIPQNSNLSVQCSFRFLWWKNKRERAWPYCNTYRRVTVTEKVYLQTSPSSEVLAVTQNILLEEVREREREISVAWRLKQRRAYHTQTMNTWKFSN